MINLILANWRDDYKLKFKDILEEATSLQWVIMEKKSKFSHKGKLGNIKRYINYFSVSFELLKKRNQYERIIVFQQFYGICLAFFLRSFKCKKTFRLYIMSFIYIPKGRGLIGKVYEWFMKYSTGSKFVDALICHSKIELDLYASQLALPMDRLQYLLFGIADDRERFKSEDQGYYLCVGRSNRDYKYIINELAGTDIQIIILCDTLKTKKQNLTDNIKVFNNVFDDEYYELLSKCTGMITILDKPNVSSGQLSIIKAMQFGKPIIINGCPAINDYIEDQVNAIVIKKESGKLEEACHVLKNDRELYIRMIQSSRKYYETYFTDIRMAYDLGNIINTVDNTGG